MIELTLSHVRSNTEIAAGSLDGGHIANGSLDGADIENDSLGGADIDESSFSPLAAAAFAEVEAPGALSGTETTVISTAIDVPVPSTLLGSASLLLKGDGGDNDQPRCRMHKISPGSASPAPVGKLKRQTIPDTAGDEATMSLLGHASVGPGTHTVFVNCDVASGGATSVGNGDLIVWSVPN